METLEDLGRRTVREELAAIGQHTSDMPALRVLEVERHYSVASVAEILEVSKPWVYARIADGRIAAVVELGDTTAKQRISASSLQTFLDGRTFGITP